MCNTHKNLRLLDPIVYLCITCQVTFRGPLFLRCMVIIFMHKALILLMKTTPLLYTWPNNLDLKNLIHFDLLDENALLHNWT